MKTRKALERLAQILYRSPRETELLSSRGFILRKWLVLGAVAAAALAFIVPAVGTIARQWAHARFTVTLGQSVWHAYFGEAPARLCDLEVHATDCPVHVDFPGWRDAIPRQSTATSYNERVRQQGTKDFWLQTKIPVETLRKAFADRANVLYLGSLRARFSLWIDHSYELANSSRVYQQLAIPIALSRLSKNEPLVVTLRLTNDIMHSWPDQLGETDEQGFLTADNATVLMQANDYAVRVPALVMATAHLILAAIFLALWGASPKKQEYFYVALYSFANAVLSCLLVDTLIVALMPMGSARAYLSMLIFKAASSLLLGLAFARVRTMLSNAVIVVVVALACTIILGNEAPIRFILFSYSQIQWIIPASALLGSLVCLHQALYLASSDRPRIWHELRVKRLVAFSFSFGLVFLVASAAILSEPVTAKWNFPYRISDLVLIYVIGAVVFSEYRDRERQLEAAPGSEYHKRPVLPERVKGAILTVDLKNSEPFYRRRARSSSDVHPVVLWRTHMNAAILRFSGCVIRNKGDEISVLFDELKVSRPALAAMQAALEIFESSKRLAEEFRVQGLLPEGVTGLNCRVAVVEGEIRPIFEKHGATLEPQWEEAGSTTPLLASSRLLEMEKSISGPDESSLIMFESVAAAHESQFAPLAGSGAVRKERCEDKHGTVHLLAIVTVGARSQTDPSWDQVRAAG